jgi:isoprenylcysteine carboxyl methyltransferase (ICMT) family protein YpbQ
MICGTSSNSQKVEVIIHMGFFMHFAEFTMKMSKKEIMRLGGGKQFGSKEEALMQVSHK